MQSALAQLSASRVTSSRTMQVAFSRTGDFFVADGYCNSRVLRYSPDGDMLREYMLPVRLRAATHPTEAWHSSQITGSTSAAVELDLVSLAVGPPDGPKCV